MTPTGRPTGGPAATVYLEHEAFAAESAELTGDTYRHLFRARRLAVDDVLKMVDGHGRAREGRITEVGRQSARVALGRELLARESMRRLSLIVAAPKPERASWLVEKATELGVSRIAWLQCERSSRRLSPSALARHGRIAISALEQCGGATLPEVSGPHPWDDFADLIASLDAWWVLDPAGERMSLGAATNETLGLAIGPEGGWSAGELGALRGLGGVPWSLGERILRVETAAVAGAAMLLTQP